MPKTSGYGAATVCARAAYRKTKRIPRVWCFIFPLNKDAREQSGITMTVARKHSKVRSIGCGYVGRRGLTRVALHGTQCKSSGKLSESCQRSIQAISCSVGSTHIFWYAHSRPIESGGKSYASPQHKGVSGPLMPKI